MTAIGSCCRARLRGIALTHKEFSFVLSLATKRKYRKSKLIPERKQDNWKENFLLPDDLDWTTALHTDEVYPRFAMGQVKLVALLLEGARLYQSAHGIQYLIR